LCPSINEIFQARGHFFNLFSRLTDISGILGRPVKPGDDTEID